MDKRHYEGLIPQEHSCCNCAEAVRAVLCSIGLPYHALTVPLTDGDYLRAMRTAEDTKHLWTRMPDDIDPIDRDVLLMPGEACHISIGIVVAPWRVLTSRLRGGVGVVRVSRKHIVAHYRPVDMEVPC